MENKTFYYARVSSKEQHLDRQIQAFKNLGAIDRDIITDKASGKDLDRPNYQALKQTMLRQGDILVVKSLDRLSRNKEDIKAELEYYKSNQIRLKVLDIPTTMIELPKEQEWVFDMINNILIEVLSSIAQQERMTIKERQADGISIAKANGKHLGRPKAIYPDNWADIYSEWKQGNITANTAMDILKLKRTTFYKLANDYKSGSE